MYFNFFIRIKENLLNFKDNVGSFYVYDSTRMVFDEEKYVSEATLGIVSPS